MTEATQQAVLHTLLDQVRQTRKAYNTGVVGVTYEDMAAAAKRYLTMQEAYVAAKQDRRPKRITQARVAALLRSL